ncbi:MAG: alpha/beta fold hydrolase [Buchnera aphidicola (Periphyllus lyropictus)]|uniref:alpha/beta fold hydrolase n=1 Tax=Buchnera aphidicola TaxID=9 RepID=UPI001EBA80A8|nr:alpha/beta fold hydrolase [Buchnera aphidicola]NIH16455.1 alpha/beta fold hydrolase [Buchnera aphidicola (Periphyllus lyropictus)]USS94740.1 alpha/beta fold hydrolase [Buchnera aphidicola (Periphyllus lyropictus)]
MKKKINLILIHGLGFNKKIWFFLKKKLKKKYNIYTINLHTPKKKKNFFYIELKKYLRKNLFKIKNNSIIIGWSIGGILATLLTLKSKKKIIAIITICSSPYFIKKKYWPGIKYKKIKKMENDLIKNYSKSIKNFLILQIQSKNKKKIKKLQKKIEKYKKPNSKCIKFNIKILYKIDTRKLIKKIKIPFFRIYGKLDIIVPKKISYLVDKILKNKQSIIIKKSNHAPFISNLNIFYKKIKKYINKIKNRNK